MRFAYIDSHGNEVPIPSLDALALRIELGAVGPETQLYDAQADHWGPAKTHEIFHTLSREADDEGFVAPPPQVASSPPAPPPASPDPGAATSEEPAKPPKPKKTPPKKEAPPGTADLGLTLAEPPPPPSAPEPTVEAAGDAELSFDLAEPPPGAGDGFDFGDIGESLELESSTPDALEPEAPMDFLAGGVEGGEDDLVLETPMSQYRPDSPPGWMEEPVEDDVLDFSSVSAEAVAEEDEILPPKGAPEARGAVPKNRPSKPKFRRSRSLSGPIVLIVILLALGVGGYVGWPLLRARISQPEVPQRPPVVMPQIPAELLARMRTLASEAVDDVVQEVDAATGEGAPAEPAQEWLSGVYLGNASQFASIEAFWTGLGEFVDRLRAGDWQVYHDALVARTEAAGIDPTEAARIVERADSGLAAAEPRRMETYDALERVVLASLDLHDFLVANEGSIEYRPANASTADPVLEAVPATPALGNQMWEMVDAITESLDALGTLDRVTRQRLIAATRDRLQQVGIE